MTHALIERLKEPTMETPKCEKCGEEINTGMMATLCQHGSDCELWPKDMRPESELLAYRMWEAGVKQQIAMYAAELSRLRQSEAELREALTNAYAKLSLAAESEAGDSELIRDLTADKDRIDWLNGRTTDYGNGWILRESSSGRGMRLHETSQAGASPDVRTAIDAARAALGETK